MARRTRELSRLLERVCERLKGKVVTRERPWRERVMPLCGSYLRLNLFGGPPSVVGRINDRPIRVQFCDNAELWIDLVYQGPHRLDLRASDPPGRSHDAEALSRPEVRKLVTDLEPFERLSVGNLLIELDAECDPTMARAEDVISRIETLDALAQALEVTDLPDPGPA